jgi:hypothetical protein
VDIDRPSHLSACLDRLKHFRDMLCRQLGTFDVPEGLTDDLIGMAPRKDSGGLDASVRHLEKQICDGFLADVFCCRFRCSNSSFTSGAYVHRAIARADCVDAEAHMGCAEHPCESKQVAATPTRANSVFMPIAH